MSTRRGRHAAPSAMRRRSRCPWRVGEAQPRHSIRYSRLTTVAILMQARAPGLWRATRHLDPPAGTQRPLGHESDALRRRESRPSGCWGVRVGGAERGGVARVAFGQLRSDLRDLRQTQRNRLSIVTSPVSAHKSPFSLRESRRGNASGSLESNRPQPSATDNTVYPCSPPERGGTCALSARRYGRQRVRDTCRYRVGVGCRAPCSSERSAAEP